MSYPKAMLSQLTDLDDSELDEQARVFSFNKKSAPPSPKVFFNPTSVFLDVPDYRNTVSQSKRYTHQPPTTPSHITPSYSEPNDLTRDKLDGEFRNMDDTFKGTLLLKKPRNSGKKSERSLSVETSKHNNDESIYIPDSKNKRYTKIKDQESYSNPKINNSERNSGGATRLNSNLVSKVNSRQASDSESNYDSDEHEEYMYKVTPHENSSNHTPFDKAHNKFREKPRNYRTMNEDTDTDGNYYTPIYPERPKNKPRGFKTEVGYFDLVSVDDPDLNFRKNNRKSNAKFSNHGRESKYINNRYSVMPDFNKARKTPRTKKAYMEDWDSEDESLPLVWDMRHGSNEYRHRRSTLGDVSLMMILCILTGFSLAMALFSMSTIPLVDMNIVAISNVLATQNELSFNVHVRASNWNLWTISIDDVNLGIYATAIPPPPPPDNSTKPSDPDKGSYNNFEGQLPPELLGTITKLEDPFIFPGSGIFRKRGVMVTVTSLFKLADPGGIEDLTKNKTNPWPKIMLGSYDLRINGLLKYKLLMQSQSSKVCAIQRIDPPAPPGKEPEKPEHRIFAPIPALSCTDDV